MDVPIEPVKLHRRLKLWASEGAYVLEPSRSDVAEQSLVINRRNGNISLQPFDAQITRISTPVDVHGIMGILTLTTSQS